MQIKSLVILFSSFFSVSVVGAQTLEAKIEKIRVEVNHISLDSNYKTKTIENDEIPAYAEHGTDGGMSVTGYYKKGELVKIVEWVGLSHYVLISEYYLYKRDIIFVFVQEKDFPYVDSTGSFDYTHFKSGPESRFYLAKGKLLKSEYHGDPRILAEDIPQMISDCKEYKKLLFKLKADKPSRKKK